ncbi:MAG: RNA polymerase sigma factor [Sphingomonadales bacterium]|nr:RNA polymerase sigma factor [Sphingomonadales bacterium]
MRAAQDGDQAAYGALLAEMLPMLRMFVRRKWGSPQDVDDIVQDVLLSLHTVRHTYDPSRPFLPWLLTIAYRRIADAARHSSSRLSHETTVDVMPETFAGDEPKSEQERKDDKTAVQQSLAGLTSGQRQAIELMKIHGLSLKEASAVTGKSVASLKVSVHRAVKALQRSIAKKT